VVIGVVVDGAADRPAVHGAREFKVRGPTARMQRGLERASGKRAAAGIDIERIAVCRDLERTPAIVLYVHDRRPVLPLLKAIPAMAAGGKPPLSTDPHRRLHRRAAPAGRGRRLIETPPVVAADRL